MRQASRAEKTLRDAEWRPDRASAEAARGCIRFRQEPDTRTGVSNVDTPARAESYSIQLDLATPLSILRAGIPRCKRPAGNGNHGCRTASRIGSKALTEATVFGRSWTWSSAIPSAA